MSGDQLAVEGLAVRELGQERSAADSPNATREQVQRLAQEFEALLLTQMLRDMRRSMAGEEASGAEFANMTDTVDMEFGRALSRAGGFGLSNALLGSLSQLAGGDQSQGDTPNVPGVVPELTVAASTRSDAPEVIPANLPARVTSAYGWRRDPLDGTPAFHKGIDIGMAYGQDVRAAASGQVVFSGEVRGYGRMVTIAHPDGRETRYAHLSDHVVRAGDVVEAGQLIGRAGHSGRATGTHLHFEVLVDGSPVDPSADRVTEQVLGAGPVRTAKVPL